MARTRIHPGESIRHTLLAAASVGDMVQVGRIFGVVDSIAGANSSLDTGAIGDDVVLDICGVHQLPKLSAEVWAFGDSIWLPAGTQELTNADPGGGAISIGSAVQAASAGDVRGMVLIAR